MQMCSKTPSMCSPSTCGVLFLSVRSAVKFHIMMTLGERVTHLRRLMELRLHSNGSANTRMHAHTHTCAHTHTSVPVVIHSRIFFFTLWLTHSFQALRFLGTLLIKMRVEYFTCCRFPSCSSLSSDLRKDTAIDTATSRWCGSTVFIRPRPSQTQKVCMWVLRSAYLRLSSMLLVIAGLSLSSSNECWDCGRSLR